MFLCSLFSSCFYTNKHTLHIHPKKENNRKQLRLILILSFFIQKWSCFDFPLCQSLPVWLPAIQKNMIIWHNCYVIFVVVIGNTPRVNIISLHHYHIPSPFHQLAYLRNTISPIPSQSSSFVTTSHSSNISSIQKYK